MKATRGNYRSLRAPMLLAVVSGLAMSASGCIIDGSTGPVDSDGDGIADIYDGCPFLPEDYNGLEDGDGCPDSNGCLPDLTIRWRIVSTIDNQVLTCDEAGYADTVTAAIDDGAYGSAIHYFPSPCPANATSGSFKVELPASGSYSVSLDLTAAGVSRSTTNVLRQGVDCSGLAVTPEAPLFVNF
jgi:hypothetical protein